MFEGFLIALCPLTLGLEVFMMIRQHLNRKEAFKNYRHFMHVSLICQTVAYVGRVGDIIVIDEDQIKDIEEFKEHGYCKFSGSI